MNDVLTVFHETLDWIKYDYASFNFFVERDFVWTVQKKLTQVFKEKNLPYKVINDCPIENGNHRSVCVDLAIVNFDMLPKDLICEKDTAELGIEFKFEPSKKRSDICVHKLPVVDWRGVLNDIERVRRFVNQNKAKIGIAIVIDEYGRFKTRKDCPENSQWLSWGNYNHPDSFDINILYTKFESESHRRLE